MTPKHRFKSFAAGLLLTAALTACTPASMAEDSLWPKVRSPIAQDADMEAKITALMDQMSVEQKVANDSGRN